MSFAALMLFGAVVAGQPATDDGADDRAPIRCRPAPYYVADRALRPKPERLIVTGSRVPLVREERRPRPCFLMEAPVIIPGMPQLRVAD